MKEYIEKEKVLLQLTDKDLPESRYSYIALINERIKNLSSEDVVPIIHSEWDGEGAYPICRNCSCNIYDEYIQTEDYAKISKPMNYCPKCGAKMDAWIRRYSN